MFEAKGDFSGLFQTWDNIMSLIPIWDNYKRIDKWIDWLQDLMNRGGCFPSIDVEAKVSSHMAFALFLRRPESPDLATWVDRALLAARERNEPNVCVRVMERLAAYYLWRGDVVKCRQMIEEFETDRSLPIFVLFG